MREQETTNDNAYYGSALAAARRAGAMEPNQLQKPVLYWYWELEPSQPPVSAVGGHNAQLQLGPAGEDTSGQIASLAARTRLGISPSRASRFAKVVQAKGVKRGSSHKSS
ncbi:hypothetical protein MCOR02_005926 [Pyricularia oryzae]|nr:hypothetical protein MCOR02_005926 [Pyricularia oryzae]KAI6252735.1 hypothetical protein MCOR19_010660 [Pyricularia oryzae]KAI6278500.1 hypothetical protein MCOR26_004629 [Pyricularia oryzae]KAI6327164.1 hypothetical protein MCOR29_003120 [Pyricularia oryzae]KAI6345111.1 hypothetical protein MCOR28_003734 [Pyricularia oryzae]